MTSPSKKNLIYTLMVVISENDPYKPNNTKPFTWIIHKEIQAPERPFEDNPNRSDFNCDEPVT